ncbi:flagellar export protein FliJ [Tissierella sp. Yu-01]|uniref:flagellar export protein FliJ n=1 Tax=Tissierella sp. Yu-01 TaxID=3035694 RepID=UPI00240D8647|nr:flagellar export protein FliJ [Tissierella sp. Yu-01]WFA07897.1 flagellar export protein FliJ [Tissierella sp. Yu-01]
MKAYSFSMEKVLEWRESLEKSSMEKFAVSQNELNQEKMILNNLTKEYEVVKEKTLRCKSISELRQLQLYKSDLEDRIENQHEIIERKTKELEDIRQELVSAQKDRKIMEKLKERDYSNYLEKVNSDEQKFLDEMAVLKFKKVEN